MYTISLISTHYANDNFAVDEALFYHSTENKKICFIGMINTNTKYFKIEAVTERSSIKIEKINWHNICEGNNIIIDGFSSFNWLNSRNSDYNHIIHGHNDFRYLMKALHMLNQCGLI